MTVSRSWVVENAVTFAERTRLLSGLVPVLRDQLVELAAAERALEAAEQALTASLRACLDAAHALRELEAAAERYMAVESRLLELGQTLASLLNDGG